MAAAAAAAAAAEEEALAILRRFSHPAGQVVPGTCLPALFAHEAFVAKVREEEAAGVALRTVSPGPPAASPGVEDTAREMPMAAFTAEELRGDRPDTLPPGFYLRRTPAELSTSVVERRKDNWTPNMFVLVMGPRYRPLFLRHVRNAEGRGAGGWPPLPCDAAGVPQPPSAFVYAELIFGAYCITFHRSMLNAPGVVFTPLFAPAPASDPNWWLRREGVLDAVACCNTVPPIPPGICLAFGRLASSSSVKKHTDPKAPGGMTFQASRAQHPVVAGRKLFEAAEVGEAAFVPDDADEDGEAAEPPLEDDGDGCSAALANAEQQDGSVGYVVFRANIGGLGLLDEREQPGQRVVLYARCAYGRSALDTLDAQRARVRTAVRFALANAPLCADGVTPAVSLDSVGGGWRELVCDPEELEAAVAGFRAVDATAHAEAQVVRWLAAANPADGLEAVRLEAAFRMKAAACCGPSPPPSAGGVTVELDGRFRTFGPEELPAVLEMVAVATARATNWAAQCAASPALHFLAPPDLDAFAGGKRVLCVGLVFRVALGTARTGAAAAEGMTRPVLLRAYRTLSDLGTRLQWDMQLFDPQLLVTSTALETHLLYMTDKAPGILSVHSAKAGLPARQTKTSGTRRVKDPNDALPDFVVDMCEESFEREVVAATGGGGGGGTGGGPSATAPPLSREAAAANPLLRLWIRGPHLPTAVPGTEVSIYRPGSKCGSTHFAGTSHAWPVYGGLVERCITTPRSEAFPWGYFGPDVDAAGREAAVDLLYPPLYNTVKGQVWDALLGRWQLPSFAPRRWQNAYGVSPAILRRAQFFLLWPATPGEYRAPGAVRVWDLKQSCEAVLHFMSRYGRIIRNVLGNRRRSVRTDAFVLPLNDVWRVKQETPPQAPVADVLLSVYNAFRHNLLMGEEPRRAANLYDSQSNPGLGVASGGAGGGGAAARRAAPTKAACRAGGGGPAAAAAAAPPSPAEADEEEAALRALEDIAEGYHVEEAVAAVALVNMSYCPAEAGSVLGPALTGGSVVGPDTLQLMRFIAASTE